MPQVTDITKNLENLAKLIVDAPPEQDLDAFEKQWMYEYDQLNTEQKISLWKGQLQDFQIQSYASSKAQYRPASVLEFAVYHFGNHIILRPEKYQENIPHMKDKLIFLLELCKKDAPQYFETEPVVWHALNHHGVSQNVELLKLVLEHGSFAPKTNAVLPNLKYWHVIFSSGSDVYHEGMYHPIIKFFDELSDDLNIISSVKEAINLLKLILDAENSELIPETLFGALINCGTLKYNFFDDIDVWKAVYREIFLEKAKIAYQLSQASAENQSVLQGKLVRYNQVHVLLRTKSIQQSDQFASEVLKELKQEYDGIPNKNPEETAIVNTINEELTKINEELTKGELTKGELTRVGIPDPLNEIQVMSAVNDLRIECDRYQKHLEELMKNELQLLMEDLKKIQEDRPVPQRKNEIEQISTALTSNEITQIMECLFKYEYSTPPSGEEKAKHWVKKYEAISQLKSETIDSKTLLSDREKVEKFAEKFDVPSFQDILSKYGDSTGEKFKKAIKHILKTIRTFGKHAVDDYRKRGTLQFWKSEEAILTMKKEKITGVKSTPSKYPK